MKNYGKHDVNVEYLMKICRLFRSAMFIEPFLLHGNGNEAAHSKVKGNLTSINHCHVNFDHHKSP